MKGSISGVAWAHAHNVEELTGPYVRRCHTAFEAEEWLGDELRVPKEMHGLNTETCGAGVAVECPVHLGRADNRMTSEESLRKLAASYKQTAAMLAVELEKLKNDPNCTWGYFERRRVAVLVGMLEDARSIATALSHYYDAPRPTWLTYHK